MGRINPLIAIGLPTWTRVSTRWARMYRHLAGPLGSSMSELEVQNTAIADARNELMTSAIEQGADFLFMLGDDVLAPGNAILALLQRMWDNPEVHIATGVYWTKGWPNHPYLWNGVQRGPYLDWKVGEWFPIDWAGCDCLLVRLSPEMKALGPQWFSTDWTWEADQPRPSVMATEDFFFYTKARQAGLKLWVDTLVQCGHEDRNTNLVFGIRDEMPQAGGVEPALPSPHCEACRHVRDGIEFCADHDPATPGSAPLVTKIAEIGAGHDTPFFGSWGKVKVVRFDGNSEIRPDYRCDLRHLPVPDATFDLIHSRHVLEHFGRAECLTVLKEWLRILRPGGELRLCLPNFLSAIKEIIAIEEGTQEPGYYPWWQVYGAQVDAYDFHRNGFTPRRLESLLRATGLLDKVEVTVGDGGSNLYATAIKTSTIVTSLALVPAWDDISSREHFQIAGLRPSNGTTDTVISEEEVVPV